MNKRIEELAEEAGWMMGDEVEGFNTRLERFAELIVRECADIAKTAAPYSSDDLILKRFGFDNV
jgi:hypothetical protein